LLPLVLLISCLSAQSTPTHTRHLSFHIHVRDVAKDFGALVSTPFRSFPRNQLVFLGITSVPALLIWKGDQPIDEEYAREERRFPISVAHHLADIGNVYNQAGSAIYVAGVTAVLGSVALFKGDTKMWQTAGLLVEAEFFTFLSVSGMKMVLGRARPFTNEGPHRFDLFHFQTQHPHISLPSLHTASVYAMATVLSDQYPRWWVKIPAYSFAVSVALQRMESREHWASDVFVGGVMGYYIAHILFERRHPGPRQRVRITLSIRENLLGMAIAF